MAKKRPKFNLGDNVVMKSGGPVMSIRDMNEPFGGGDEYSYTAQWFSGKKLERGQFSESQLEPPKKKDQ